MPCLYALAVFYAFVLMVKVPRCSFCITIGLVKFEVICSPRITEQMFREKCGIP